MPAFEYKALNNEGGHCSGIIHADSLSQARQLLINQQVIPLYIDETRAKGNRLAWLNGRLNQTDLVLMTRELATLVEAGEPLDMALEGIARHAHKTHVRRIIAGVRTSILEGASLAESLRGYAGSFPDFYIATVSAGEHSGNLGMILYRLADYIETRHKMKQKFMLALLYPAMVTSIAVIVIMALLTYVVPQVIAVYSDLDQQLPTLTLMLISTSDFLRAYYLPMIMLGIVFIVLMGLAYRTETTRYQIHHLLLAMPLLGRNLREVQVARYSHTLSILLASGVNILEAMEIAARVMNLLPMRERVVQAVYRVREGETVKAALQATDDFPMMSLQLIGSGENSGKLDDMLARSANNLEQSVDLRIATLLSLFEPLLILLMGGVVLVIVLAVLLPIFDLNQMVKI